MGTETVFVGYDESKKRLTFDREDLTVKGRNVMVIWKPAPGSEVERVTGINLVGWTPEDPDDNEQTPHQSGKFVQWKDPNSTPANYKYVCKAKLKNGNEVETDPQIINTGG